MRQAPLRIADLLGDVVGVLPAAVGEEHRHQGRAHGEEPGSPSGTAAPEGEAPACAPPWLHSHAPAATSSASAASLSSVKAFWTQAPKRTPAAFTPDSSTMAPTASGLIQRRPAPATSAV